MSQALQRFLLATALLMATAFWTPWWGTALVAFSMALLSGFSTRLLILSSFSGWLIALGLRDILNDGGPSRILIRMLSMPGIDSTVAQLMVIALVALIGAGLGGGAAGLVNSVKKWRQAN